MTKKEESVEMTEAPKDIEKGKLKPSWIKMKADEMEKIVIELAKKGESPAKIGLILRDKYGVPHSKMVGKKITSILKDKGVVYKTEKDILDLKVDSLRKHILKNKHDYNASKSLTKKLWVLNKFEKVKQ